MAHLRKTKNPLLVKDDVGKPKPATVDLPDQQFVFGKPDKKDAEGAKEVTMSWQVHVPNPEALPGRDFRALNKMSVSQKCVSAKTTGEFRKDHDARLKIGNTGPGRSTLPSERHSDFVYGRASSSSTPMSLLIGNNFAREWEVKQNEQYIKTELEKKVVGKMPPPRPTKASEGHKSVATTRVNPTETESQFKLKKFQRTSPRVYATSTGADD
eukprot:GILJ01001048.1.p1 GENE.GILJ01001048.1~~GILJ01001048.1.p1  ORF type:complete len:212 (+),score=25.94 GILJ01001048.1:74-709(+)